MKTICRMISVVLISMFVFSLTSCSDDDSYVPDEQQASVSIRLTFLESLTKTVDEDDEEDQIIEMKGVVVDQNTLPMQVNVELYNNSNMIFIESCKTDDLGCFKFKIDSHKNYKIYILKDKKILRIKEINNM